MKSEDGTGSRHAHVVLKEMQDCHPAYFIHFEQIAKVICSFFMEHFLTKHG